MPSLLRSCLLAAIPLFLGACEAPREEVILYSSVDDYLLRHVVGDFQSRTGLRVRVAGDTEATKTTGLVQRLIAQRHRPAADVWWSSEPFGTLRLADEGLLEPYVSPVEHDFPWPTHLRDPGHRWYAFSPRARVLVVNTVRVGVTERPRRLGDLATEPWRGRVGMARPQFGTTRGHMGALAASWGPEAFRRWLTALRDNGLRLYDGNSAVVRAVAVGEIDVGLTDTDDVWAGRRLGWPVEAVFELPDEEEPFPSLGTLLVPCTVAVIRGGPHPSQARRLVDFLLSPHVELLLTHSEAQHLPLRPGAEGPPWAPPPSRAPSLQAIHEALPLALRVCDEVLAGR